MVFWRGLFRSLTYESGALTANELVQLEEDLDIPVAILRKLAADEIRTTRIVREIEDLCSRHNKSSSLQRQLVMHNS